MYFIIFTIIMKITFYSLLLIRTFCNPSLLLKTSLTKIFDINVLIWTNAVNGTCLRLFIRMQNIINIVNSILIIRGVIHYWLKVWNCFKMSLLERIRRKRIDFRFEFSPVWSDQVKIITFFLFKYFIIFIYDIV